MEVIKDGSWETLSGTSRGAESRGWPPVTAPRADLIPNFMAWSTCATIAMAFAFSVHFAKGVKKAGNIPKKKRKTVEPHFPTEQEIVDKNLTAQRLARELSDEVTMISGGLCMTNPEGEVVKIDSVGDLSAHPWVINSTGMKHEAAMQMSTADANGRVLSLIHI